VFGLTTRESEAFRRLDAAANGFFTAPHEVRQLSRWPGHGMWAGYQPMPDGDIEVIDHVDRFETPQAMLATSNTEWPWLSAEARALRPALEEVTLLARNLVAATVEEVARLSGRDPDAARRLWCDHDASTLVVNAYRTVPVEGSPVAEKMKPHRDFGGLTLVQVDSGLDALQFQSCDSWRSAGDRSDHSDLAVMLIGQLFAHWLGMQAPIHRVTQEPHRSRRSTVYFHQPNLDTVIVGPDGGLLVAGAHIRAMQDLYNLLGVPPA